ncbi:hypothetical protein [Mucilaginibacter lappiensis]|uniref:Uncharacterized protein n=1 Tax=Mucilaginibacter lappiensis TaxID=354630 RepID=A0A841JFD4_9SPHI|nr:hypothetical protein [Mucilaginibacter lappiensis]MBB6129873.1 hypothetical protein [Mucilaginibacter lappiensis]
MNTKTSNVAEFTATQNERFNSIFPIIGASASEVIINLKGRGRSSWKNTLENIHVVNNPLNTVEKNYYKELDQAIDLDEEYTPNLITQIVCEARYATGMPAFQSKIETNCENELFKLFLWEDVYEPSDNDEKKIFRGYKPICRLRK